MARTNVPAGPPTQDAPSQADRLSAETAGLTADDLTAEQALDLPVREALSLLDVGGVEIGVPPPAYLDGLLDDPLGHPPLDAGDAPAPSLPEGLPGSALPTSELPSSERPVELPTVQPDPVEAIDPVSTSSTTA